jgi:hypothetical protein
MYIVFWSISANSSPNSCLVKSTQNNEEMEIDKSDNHKYAMIRRENIEIIDSLSEEVYVRIEPNETLNPIKAMGEGASLKALNMEEGRARHLFRIMSGIGVGELIKKPTYYYHFIFGKRVSENNAWLFGKPVSSFFKIESVEFPGKMGEKAAREEFRVSEGTIETHDVLSIRIADADKQLREHGTIIFHTFKENAQKIVEYRLDFRKLMKDLKIQKESGLIEVNFDFGDSQTSNKKLKTK